MSPLQLLYLSLVRLQMVFPNVQDFLSLSSSVPACWVGVTMHAEMICALLRDVATAEFCHSLSVISWSVHLPHLPSGKQPVSPRTIAHSTGRALPSMPIHFFCLFDFLFYLKQWKIEEYLRIWAVIKKPRAIPLCFCRRFLVRSMAFPTFFFYSVPSVCGSRCWLKTVNIFVVSQTTHFPLQKDAKPEHRIHEDNFRDAVYILSSRCCCWTNKRLKVSSGGWERTVLQRVLTVPRILSSISSSGPLRLGDPLLQPWTCSTRWLCWDTDLWVRLAPSKKPTLWPRSQPSSILWLSGLLCVRAFHKFFINTGKLHLIYSICHPIDKCGVIH